MYYHGCARFRGEREVAERAGRTEKTTHDGKRRAASGVLGTSDENRRARARACVFGDNEITRRESKREGGGRRRRKFKQGNTHVLIV